MIKKSVAKVHTKDHGDLKLGNDAYVRLCTEAEILLNEACARALKDRATVLRPHHFSANKKKKGA